MKINKKRLIILICDILILIVMFTLIKSDITNKELQKQQAFNRKPLLADTNAKKFLVMLSEKKKIDDIAIAKKKIIDAQIKVIPVVAKSTYFIEVINGQITESSLLSICKFIGSKYSIPPELLYAMCEKESTRKVNARNGSCKGLMQISEQWHIDRMNKLNITNIYEPYSNVLLAADFMNELKQEKNNVYYNLMRYNMSINTANTLFAKGKISTYALSIVSRSEELRKEGI